MSGVEQEPSIGTIQRKPREACGIVGFVPNHEDATMLAYNGLITVQNRGEDAAGVALYDGISTNVIHGENDVERAFEGGRFLSGSEGARASLGHVLYSTDEASKTESIQPFYFDDFAFAHNGQFTNSRALAKRYGINPGESSDSKTVGMILDQRKRELGSIENALDEVLPRLSGAFSIGILEKDKLIAARDRRGFRPLNIGMLAEGGYGIASESAVFDVIDGVLINSVQPGTYVILTKNSISEKRWAEASPAICGLEFAYFSRSDSTIDGIEVASVRKKMGEFLAEDHPADADVVIPMPDSGRQAANGYSKASGIEKDDGFYKNHKIGRTYIQAKRRNVAAWLKNNPIRSVVSGKRLVVADDSVIRGNTINETASRLRDKGAKEVHLRSAFPPVRYQCAYGMNMRKRDGLVAVGRDEEEIARELSVDSVGYLSVERFEEAVGKVGQLCMACVTGEYPEPIEDNDRSTKEVLVK